MVQKPEELHDFGIARYSDVFCVVVPLASISLVWSDRTAPRLHLLQLLAHTYMYTMDFIAMHAATYYFGLLGGHTFEKYITLCNNLQRKWGVGVLSGVDVLSRGYGNYIVKVV